MASETLTTISHLILQPQVDLVIIYTVLFYSILYIIYYILFYMVIIYLYINIFCLIKKGASTIWQWLFCVFGRTRDVFELLRLLLSGMPSLQQSASFLHLEGLIWLLNARQRPFLWPPGQRLIITALYAIFAIFQDIVRRKTIRRVQRTTFVF